MQQFTQHNPAKGWGITIGRKLFVFTDKAQFKEAVDIMDESGLPFSTLAYSELPEDEPVSDPYDVLAYVLFPVGVR